MSTIHMIELGRRRPSRQLAELLAATLGVPAERRALFFAYARGVTTPDQSAVISAAPMQATATNLPVPLTDLIGRADLLVEIGASLARDTTRILTLTGPPGIGKTRLALEVAATFYKNGGYDVYWVPLAPLTDHTRVMAAIAQALGLPDSGGQAVFDQVRQKLAKRSVLLVLDNFEQVIEAAASIAELLAVCATVKALVTSREPLHVRGERFFLLPPLAVVTLDPDQTEAPEKLLQSPALALFVARAQAVDPGFTLNAQNLATITAICVALDGLPLALELVAARTRLLPPAALLTRLRDGLSALDISSGGQRDLPPRHRALRDAINWSFELLDAAERSLFMRLGVFNGGWTLPAAEAVCNARGDLATAVFAAAGALFDKSLIGREISLIDSDEPRFAMLATIREFALEQLQKTGELNEARRCHAEYFLVLAQATEPRLTGPDQQVWLNLLAADHENLRAALGWLLDTTQGELAGQLAGALTRFWFVQSHFSEGRAWLERVLASEEVSLLVRIKALSGAGLLARGQGDYEVARRYLEQSLVLAQQQEHKPAIALALKDLGVVIDLQGDLEKAFALYQASLSVYDELGDLWGVAACLTNLGTVRGIQGRDQEASAFFAESLLLRRKIGDKQGVAGSLANLGISYLNEGDYTQAARVGNEALLLFREVGDQANTALVLTNLGYIEHLRGEYSQAVEFYQQALLTVRRLGDKLRLATVLNSLSQTDLALGDLSGARAALRECLQLLVDMTARRIVMDCLESFAKLALASNQAERAVLLYAAAASARTSFNAPLNPADLAAVELSLRQAHAQLARETYNANWLAGVALTLDEAVALAFQG